MVHSTVGKYANLCYFNYQYSGESVGRAMVGLEFDSVADRDACRADVAKLIGTTIQSIQDLPDTVRRRVLDSMSPLEHTQERHQEPTPDSAR